MQLEYTFSELYKAAASLASLIKTHKVIALHGEMGAGKTTLVSALCNLLGTADVVGSPTYSIINQYKLASAAAVYHMDWYRLKDEEEAIQAGVEEAFYTGNICLVEWPEKAAALLPDDTLHVYITTVDEHTRRIITAGV